MSYLSEIEQRLGSWRKLPKNPFSIQFECAIFPSLHDELLDEVLYAAIFKMNEQLGNRELIFRSFVDLSTENPNLLVQAQRCWTDVEEFQESSLVCEGFYVTGDKFNWLGIYHPDDYFIVGAKKELLETLSLNIYGHLDWKKEFVRKYEDGQLGIYSEDFEQLKKHLLKK